MNVDASDGSAAYLLLNEIAEVRDRDVSRTRFSPCLLATPVSGALLSYLWYLDQRIGYLRNEARFEVEGSLSHPGPLTGQERLEVLDILNRIGNSPENLDERRLACLEYVKEAELRTLEEHCEVRGLSEAALRIGDRDAVARMHRYLQAHRGP